MDPVTIAILTREVLKTALQVRDIYSKNDADADTQFAELLAKISANAELTYEDFDPNLDADLAKARNS